jgi:hypothetical protein
MAYRDARGQAMTDPDWSEIECRLRRAYRPLKAAVAGAKTSRERLIFEQQKSPGRCRGF